MIAQIRDFGMCVSFTNLIYEHSLSFLINLQCLFWQNLSIFYFNRSPHKTQINLEQNLFIHSVTITPGNTTPLIGNGFSGQMVKICLTDLLHINHKLIHNRTRPFITSTVFSYLQGKITWSYWLACKRWAPLWTRLIPGTATYPGGHGSIPSISLSPSFLGAGASLGANEGT